MRSRRPPPRPPAAWRGGRPCPRRLRCVPASGSSATSSSSLMVGPAVFSLISPSPPPSSPSSLSAICSAVGPFDSMASRSMISRSCMRPSLRAFDQSMMALKVMGLSQRPQIMMSRPASMRLAMAISPSRERSSTAPISRRYMRTGSSVRSTASFLVAAAGRGPPSSRGSTSSSAGSSSFSSSSSEASSFSTTLMPMSLIADMTSSICSDAIWSWGRASLSSSIVMKPRFFARAIIFLIDASLRSISGASPLSCASVSTASFFAMCAAA